jgi:hypothetical protein
MVLLAQLALRAAPDRRANHYRNDRGDGESRRDRRVPRMRFDQMQYIEHDAPSAIALDGRKSTLGRR